MGIHDIKVRTITGDETSLADFSGKAMLIVNVASRCGMTPQYEGLQKLHESYASRGLAVLGFPCNQFGNQEPGSHEEIQEFCSTNYGVEFPLFEKVEVNGQGRHPLYEQLTQVSDHKGEAGDVKWNFEKFLVSPSGEIVGRFRSTTPPDNRFLVAAIEENLPG